MAPNQNEYNFFCGWNISVCHLTQFSVKSAGRGRKDGEEAVGKLNPICSYTTWEQPEGSPEEKYLGVAVDEKQNMTCQHALAV